MSLTLFLLTYEKTYSRNKNEFNLMNFSKDLLISSHVVMTNVKLTKIPIKLVKSHRCKATRFSM